MELILQPFRHFTYVTTHSPTLLSLYLRHSSFSNPSFTSRTSQFILQPFFRFSCVTSPSLNSPDELPMTRIFSELLRSVQMLKKEWCPKSNGMLPHLLILGKTATLVPDFGAKERQPWCLSLQSKTCPWAEHSDE